ncbi:hypothetical protein [Rhodococcus erythropolis]|uniref:hypothetical protein n=1 Tax=Rhodococcus erythropolis TaxID=1833 RepID=UPI0008786176|nr:hypothetical protein [Rhodococcus erythropolis]OFV72762.1 hypothetical protein RERY_65780 [Rhodococcus erythropolis]
MDGGIHSSGNGERTPDFDPERADLADALAALNGFVGVERNEISVTALDAFDATAETFAPS